MRTAVVALAVALAGVSTLPAEPVVFEETDPLPVRPALEAEAGGALLPFFASSGGLLVVGDFDRIQGAERRYVARIGADGAVDGGYTWQGTPLPVGWPWASFAGTPDGVLYFLERGNWSEVTGWIRRALADGRPDESFAVRAMLDEEAGRMLRLVATADGRVAVLGEFNRLGDVATRNIGVITAEGQVDTAFQAEVTDLPVVAFPVAEGGWVVVLQVSGQAEVRIVRFEADGSLDTGFAEVRLDGSMLDPWKAGPHAFAMDRAGRIVFAEVDPSAAPTEGYPVRLKRILADGGLDPDYTVALPPIAQVRSAHIGIAPEPLPEVRQIMPLEDGALACVAVWAAPQPHGLAGVTASGAVDASVLPDVGEGYVRRFWRDLDGRLWAQVALDWRPDLPARLVRLADADGMGVDLELEALAEVPRALWRPRAADNGGVVIAGAFDRVDGQHRPGFVRLDGEGNILEDGAPTWPWPRAEVFGLSRDGGVFLREAVSDRYLRPTGAYRWTTEGAPEVVYVTAEGQWVSFERRAAQVEQTRASSAWFDASGRVWVHFGELYPDGQDATGDAGTLARYTAAGELEKMVSPVLMDGAVAAGAMEAVTPTADRTGFWAVMRSVSTSSVDDGNRVHLVRADGEGVVSMRQVLWLEPVAGRHGVTVTDLLGVPGGVLLAGEFDGVNGVPVSGILRIREDGTIDTRWGGWLLAGSVVREVRTVGGDVMVVGELQTPEGSRSAVLLDAAGLPSVSGRPEGVVDPLFPAMSSSPDGRWWVESGGNVYGVVPPAVRRWRAAAYPDVRVVPSVVHPEPMSTVVLEIALPTGDLTAVRWYRNGVELAGAGESLTIPVAEAEDGAIYQAVVDLVGGESIRTSAWRLNVARSGTRMTNISIRAWLADEAEPLVVGAVTSGQAPGVVLARALGPALAEFGVSDPAGPLGLELLGRDGGVIPAPAEFVERTSVLGLNHPDVRAVAEQVGAWQPNLDLVAGNRQMVYENVTPGPLFEHVRLQAAPGGVVLAELYFPWERVNDTSGMRLVNFSGRALLHAGNGALVGGFVIEGDEPMRVLVRAVGPGLEPLGVTSAARDPWLELFREEERLAENDDWSADPENRAAVEAASEATGSFALAEGSSDAALVVDLSPGVYTVVAQPGGSADVGREVLLEVFAVP